MSALFDALYWMLVRIYYRYLTNRFLFQMTTIQHEPGDCVVNSYNQRLQYLGDHTYLLLIP